MKSKQYKPSITEDTFGSSFCCFTSSTSIDWAWYLLFFNSFKLFGLKASPMFFKFSWTVFPCTQAFLIAGLQKISGIINYLSCLLFIRLCFSLWTINVYRVAKIFLDIFSRFSEFLPDFFRFSYRFLKVHLFLTIFSSKLILS